MVELSKNLKEYCKFHSKSTSISKEEYEEWSLKLMVTHPVYTDDDIIHIISNIHIYRSTFNISTEQALNMIVNWDGSYNYQGKEIFWNGTEYVYEVVETQCRPYNIKLSHIEKGGNNE